MKLYNVSGLSRYPKMRIAKSKLSYLEHGEDKDDMMLSTEVAREREYWADRVAPMLADTTFEPNPGNACRWCPYSVGKQTTIPADIRAQHVAAMPKGENPCPF